MTATIPTRPPLTKVADFVVKTDRLEEARRFYSGDLGYDDVFRYQRAISGRAGLSLFKVADEQYIEVAEVLQNPKLSDYLALPATTLRGVNT